MKCNGERNIKRNEIVDEYEKNESCFPNNDFSS
jgi:hypothetical protein